MSNLGTRLHAIHWNEKQSDVSDENLMLRTKSFWGANTACTRMIAAVLSGHNGFGNARRSLFPTWNETAGIQVLIACVITLAPPPPLSLGPWRYKEKMATPEQKAFCVLQFAKHESVQRAFRQQFQSDPQSYSSIRR
jgi:hypothetical protein